VTTFDVGSTNNIISWSWKLKAGQCTFYFFSRIFSFCDCLYVNKRIEMLEFGWSVGHCLLSLTQVPNLHGLQVNGLSIDKPWSPGFSQINVILILISPWSSILILFSSLQLCSIFLIRIIYSYNTGDKEEKRKPTWHRF
jgi:hypothetical protein